MEEEIAWLMNSLSTISSPFEPLQSSDIILISTKKHQIQLRQSSLTHDYCLPLFRHHKIPPIQNISFNAPQGSRKSFRQSYESNEEAELCLQTFIFLLNQCWGYSPSPDADDKKLLDQTTERYIQVHLNPDQKPIDFMIRIMHSFLYPPLQCSPSTTTDSDEEFDRAAKALSAISTNRTHPSDDMMTIAKETSTLAQRILATLSAYQSMKAHVLAKELNVSKPEVNQCLYRVLQTQDIHNSDHTWSLSGIRSPTAPHQRNQRKRAGDDHLVTSTSQSPLQNQIETYLRNSSPCDAQTLRRALSIQRTKFVNQALYELLRIGRVLRSEDQPPLWSISRT
jgi:hypothetical protein